MKVSLNLAQYNSAVNINAIGVDALLQKIGAQLGAVEEVVYTGPHYDKIVVVQVISCVQHPNADRLHVCTIDDGGITPDVKRDEKGYVQVVCGAPNVREGLTVAWLPPGSTVPSSLDKDPFVLEARELRGVVSNGMLASAAELGMSDDHDGILEIKSEDVGEENLKPGTPFKNLYGLDDVIIDCENKMFTHRPDCFGTLGVARELAGIQNLKFKSPDWYLEAGELENNSRPQDSEIKSYGVDNQISDLVPRYMLVSMDNITVGPSPVWLQAYLSRVGIRPINNIVDMTNYMMMLTGQPLHVFDFDKIAKNGNAQIVVRHPKDNETITLLDGKTITPRKEAILICDSEKPIALGGVMGGNNSEIDEHTTRILIEAATFNMYNIRKTSMEHGVFTDAVARFNKGQSPWQCAAVLAKAVAFTKEVSKDARLIGKAIDTAKELAENQTVTVTAEFINTRLGSKLTVKDIAALLENVEFKTRSAPADPSTLHITAPYWRMDIELPEDIVEEVGRLHGFDTLPAVLPARSAQAAPKDPVLSLKQTIRTILASAGANEVLTYTFVHGKLLHIAGQSEENAYTVRNALSPDLQFYRLSLTPSLLDKVTMNIRAGYDQFVLFELNKTHDKTRGLTDEKVPVEDPMLALVFTAHDKLKHAGAAFYAARAYLDFLTHKLGISLDYQPLDEGQADSILRPFDLKRTAKVLDTATGTFLGYIGEYKQDVRKNFKLPEHTAGFEINIQELIKCIQPLVYTVSSKYPSQSQDITLELPHDTSFAVVNVKLAEELRAICSQQNFVFAVKPVGIYQPNEDKVRFTFRITLTHPNRTLKTEETNALLDEVAGSLRDSLHAEKI